MRYGGYREDQTPCCGNCAYNSAEYSNGHFCGYSCGNQDSDAYGQYTSYSDCCEDWDSKD